MSSTKNILTSLHGRRVGISHDGRLVINGKVVPAMDDSGAMAVIQGAPSAKTVAVTLTAAELLSGIITATHTAGATAAYTLPTGALLDAAAGIGIGEAFDWVLINLSAAALDTVTVTEGATHTIVGVAIVQSSHATTGLLYGASAQFRSRKTAADTFVTYRI